MSTRRTDVGREVEEAGWFQPSLTATWPRI